MGATIRIRALGWSVACFATLAVMVVAGWLPLPVSRAMGSSKLTREVAGVVRLTRAVCSFLEQDVQGPRMSYDSVEELVRAGGLEANDVSYMTAHGIRFLGVGRLRGQERVAIFECAFTNQLTGLRTAIVGYSDGGVTTSPSAPSGR